MLQSVLYLQQALLRSKRDEKTQKMKNESVKKSLENSKNVIEQRKMVKQKIRIKTHVYNNFINFVQEQLKSQKIAGK